MRARVLDETEWTLQGHTDMSLVLGASDPGATVVVVVEDDSGAVVGSIAAMRIVHLEGTWIAPEYRGNPAVARKLLRAGLGAARSLGAQKWVYINSDEDRTANMIERLGGQSMPIATHAVPTNGVLSRV